MVNVEERVRILAEWVDEFRITDEMLEQQPVSHSESCHDGDDDGIETLWRVSFQEEGVNGEDDEGSQVDGEVEP